MAKKLEPELFSANLFTSSGTGGEDSFAFGESSGKLPAAQILFAEPAAGSSVDPFAQLSNPNGNNAAVTVGALQSRPDGGAASQTAAGGSGGSAEVRSGAGPGAPFVSTADQRPVGASVMGMQPESTDVTGLQPQHNTMPAPAMLAAENVATIPVTMIGSAATNSNSPPLHNQLTYASAPFVTAGDAQPYSHPSFSGPPLGTSSQFTGFSAPHVGYSGPHPGFAGTQPGPATLPSMTSSNPPSTYGSMYSQNSVMEPVDMSHPAAGGRGLVGFGDGGFPTQAPPAATSASTGSALEPTWVSPPQASAMMQPLPHVAAPSVSTAPNPYSAFQPPMAMNPLPVEQEWREQQEMVQKQVPPLHFHWFYCKADKWIPFSVSDSNRLEEAQANSLKATMDLSSFVPTEGGRYDVELESRQRHAVYWDEPVCEVRRCSWFFKGDPMSDFSPYREDETDALEIQYQQACIANVWPARFDFKGSTIHMHNAEAMVHLPPLPAVPGPVRRGLDPASPALEGEPIEVEHLVFVIHGVGPVADLRYRSIYECVDDWRSMSTEMQQQHFPHRGNRHVEFLPVAWHEALHGDTTGVNRKLRDITLGSCQRLRDFVNEFLLDILFYMSPAYCQTIMSTVAGEMERMYNLFQSRNPGFAGEVSVMGHSLGTCILYDLLAHQGMPPPPLNGSESGTASESSEKELEEEEVEEPTPVQPPESVTVASALSMFDLSEFIEKFEAEKIDLDSFQMMSGEDFKEMGVPMGPRKKLIGYLREQNQAQEAYKRQLAEAEARKAAVAAGREERRRRRHQAEKEKATSAAKEKAEGIHRIAFQHSTAGVGMAMIRYPQLSFKLKSLYCLGSPIGMFLTIRGGTLGPDYALPTCRHVVNIFHPFDPVAYRVEPLVNLAASSVPPSLVPHHKGRKRLHLELRDNLGRVGANLKKNFLESMRYTWQAVQQFAVSHSGSAWEEQVAKEQLEQQEKVQAELEAVSNAPPPADDSAADESSVDPPPTSVDMGKLNAGERIDFVLQEHPFESFNEYLFAMQSHLCYWTSEDSSLHVLRHMFANGGPSSALPMAVQSHTGPAVPAQSPSPAP